jgi:hypothetical protein
MARQWRKRFWVVANYNNDSVAEFFHDFVIKFRSHLLPENMCLWVTFRAQ